MRISGSTWSGRQERLLSHLDAFVLAAGKSERIAGIAGGIPKPLLQVAGEPILVRNIRWLVESGVRDLWINLHFRGDLIRETIGDGSRWGARIRYSEEPEILGTAGAVRRVWDHLRDTVLVVYGDNLLDFDLGAFEAFHRHRQGAVSIALFDDTNPHTGIAGGRVALDRDARVIAFVEGTGSAAPFVNAGVYLVDTRKLAGAFPSAGYLDWGREVFPALLRQGAPIFGYHIDGYCLGLDTADSYRRAMDLIGAGVVRLR